MTMSATARTRARWNSRSAWSGAVRVDLRRPVRPPPEVGQGVDPVLGLDDERRVLLGVAGRQPELGVRRHAPAVAAVIEPEVVPVARPEVDDLGVREQRDVDRVIRVVVAEEDVGHGLGADAERGERIEDQRARRDEAGIGDDQGVAVADERDAAADRVPSSRM